MKQLMLVLLVAVASLSLAQQQEVEYGLLHLGPASSWSHSAGGHFGSGSVVELYEEMTRSTWPAEHPPEWVTVYIFEHLASWGWRLHSTVPQAGGGVQYIWERACDHQPSGCYQEGPEGQAEG